MHTYKKIMLNLEHFQYKCSLLFYLIYYYGREKLPLTAHAQMCYLFSNCSTVAFIAGGLNV
jgi:hypothetical protein